MDVPRNPLVKQLLDKDGKPLALTVLVGFVGDADAANAATHVRVYASLTLDSYVDVPVDNIRATCPLGSTNACPTVLWVDQDASIRHTTKARDYLSGSIADQHLSAAATASVPCPHCGVPAALPTSTAGCGCRIPFTATTCSGCAFSYADFPLPTSTRGCGSHIPFTATTCSGCANIARVPTSTCGGCHG